MNRIVRLILAASLLAFAVVIFRLDAALKQQTALTEAAGQQNANIHMLAANIAARLQLDPDQGTAALLADIEKQIGPRQVSAADSTAIANTLLAAGMFNFQVDVLADDPETRRFARQLFNTLLLAGWAPANPGLVDAYTDGAYDVAISAATKTGEPAAYRALTTAFAQAGIATLADPGRKPLAPPGTVEIFVGDKP